MLVFEIGSTHRSLVLSIKLAVMEVLLQRSRCVLDDVMSELDNTRQFKIIRNDFSFNPNLYYNNKKTRSSSKSAENLKTFYYSGW